MKKVSAHSLRGKTKDELVKLLNDNKKALSELNVQRYNGTGGNKLGHIKVLRKNIARMWTVMHTNQKEQLRKFYAKKKYVPKDLRPKLTRAKRRELTPKQKSLRTLKEERRLRSWPSRVYALKQ